MRRFAVNTSALAPPGLISSNTPYVLGGAASASSSWCNTASLSREAFSNSASFAFRAPSSRLARRSTCKSTASISDDVIMFDHLHVVPRHLATLAPYRRARRCGRGATVPSASLRAHTKNAVCAFIRCSGRVAKPSTFHSRTNDSHARGSVKHFC